MVIDLNEYRKTKAARAAATDRQAQLEYIDTDAIATIDLIFCFQRPAEYSAELPHDSACLDGEGILDQIHALASQS